MAGVHSVVSRVAVQTKTVQWKVEGWSRLPAERNKKLDSGTLANFSFGGIDIRFQMSLYKGGFYKSEKDEGHRVSITSYMTSSRRPSDRFGSHSEPLWAVDRMSANGPCGKDWGTRLCGEIFTIGQVLRSTISDHHKSFALRYVVDDSLTITVTVSVWVPAGTSANDSHGNYFDKGDHVTRDFRALRSSAEGSDIMLKAGLPGDDGEEPLSYPAHRIILAARSPVFSRMFFGPTAMKEASSGSEVVLSEVQSPIVDGFLHFLYTGSVPKDVQSSQDTICHLLSVAHQYEVTSLVDSCVDALIAGLSEENAAERLMFADLIGVTTLKGAALAFICESPERLSDIQGTESFERLSEKRPRLLVEVMAKLAPPKPRKKRPAEQSELPENLGSKSLAALKQLCGDRGLHTSGTKQVLIGRLRQSSGGQ